MNVLEKIIYLRIAEYPSLRIPIVNLYQRIFGLFPGKNFFSDRNILVFPGFFFGFHDKCPWSYDGKMILSHKFDTRINFNLVENHPIKLGIFKYEDSWRFYEVGNTRTWNWQQGSGLQWIGRTNNIIFNDFRQQRCIAKIIDTKGLTIKTLTGHIASISHDGKYALKICYERLGCGMPGYGYNLCSGNGNLKGQYLGNVPENANTISIIDINRNKERNLFEICDILNINYNKKMENAFHFFSHCLFSKNSKRIVFFHRWLMPNGRLDTRMFSSDLNGNDLFLFQGSHFSHITWKNDKYILAYCKPPEKPIGLYLLKDRSCEFKAIDRTFFSTDGHPQLSNDDRYILIDTYPNRSRFQFLKVYDLKTKQGTVLAKLRIPFEYRMQRRCDFHPRWSRDDKMICIDSAHTGTRSLCILQNIDKILK